MAVVSEINDKPRYILELSWDEARSLQILIDNYVCGDGTRFGYEVSPITKALFDIASGLNAHLGEVPRFFGELDPEDGIRFRGEQVIE